MAGRAGSLIDLATRGCRRVGRGLAALLLWRINYARLRQPKRVGGIEDTPAMRDRIADDLRAAGIAVRDLDIDPAGYREYLRQARYESCPHYQRGGRAQSFAEKSLEHYIAARLLSLSPGDTYIDVASARSPAADIYSRLFGCTSYQQDIVFRPGVRGSRVGGSASAMPLADGFASAMTLHCSFEHFEAPHDTGFVREAGRVLRPGGRLCIVPLYLATEYAVLVDPAHVPLFGPNRIYEPDAALQCVRRFGSRHCRFYDVPHFLGHVVAHLGPLRLTVYRLQGVETIGPHCYARFAALLER